jgi:N-acetylglucosamine-6-phosphate deacetylase
LHLQEKSLAAQQRQTEASGTTITSIKEPHAVAFASLCKYLGMELMPGLDDIHVIGGEEEDAQEGGDKEEMEEEVEGEEGKEGSIAPPSTSVPSGNASRLSQSLKAYVMFGFFLWWFNNISSSISGKCVRLWISMCACKSL